MSPLFDKLNFKSETQIVVMNAPSSFEPALTALAGTKILRKMPTSKNIHFVMCFVITQADVDAAAKSLTGNTSDDPIIWFAYPKQSSKKYPCEFNRDEGWAALGSQGYEAVRQVAIDEDWSALRFRQVAFIKSLTRAPTRAVSAAGKQRTSVS
jgi:hypothetical protein